MNTQFIKGLSIDWNRIAPYSYLREIAALHDLKSLEFTSPITFFVGGEWQRQVHFAGSYCHSGWI